MSQSEPSTLADFPATGVTEPDTQTETPDELTSKVESLDSFHNMVVINDNDNPLHVGMSADEGSSAYQLYHTPNNPHNVGPAGLLVLKEHFNDQPNEISFHPPDEDSATTVCSLEVHDDPKTDQLSRVINEIRTELTGEDWVSNRSPRTDLRDWENATLELIDFYLDHYETPQFDITQPFLKGSTMHAIGRYPGDGDKVLSMASMRIDRLNTSPRKLGRTSNMANQLNGLDRDTYKYIDTESVSPFGLRELLLDFASARGIP